MRTLIGRYYEEKLTTLEKERPDEMEMAA